MVFISVFEVRMLLIIFYDKIILGEIEKVILKLDLGLILNNDGFVLCLFIL